MSLIYNHGRALRSLYAMWSPDDSLATVETYSNFICTIWSGKQTKAAGKEKNSWHRNFILQKANFTESGYDEINNCRDATEICERKECEGQKTRNTLIPHVMSPLYTSHKQQLGTISWSWEPSAGNRFQHDIILLVWCYQLSRTDTLKCGSVFHGIPNYNMK